MDPQQEIRLLIGSMTVDNILLRGRVQELETQIGKLTQELVIAKGQSMGDEKD